MEGKSGGSNTAAAATNGRTIKTNPSRLSFGATAAFGPMSGAGLTPTDCVTEISIVRN